MSEIKFACPTCTQHLTAGPDLFGAEIACPNCQVPFVVPGGDTQVADAPAHGAVMPQGELPKSARFLAWYYLVGAAPFILFALFGLTIPPEDLTNHPQSIERDRAFIQAMKVLIFGALLVYALAHALAGFGVLKSKRWGYIAALVLSLLGAIHLNPFAVPGLVICFRSNVREYFS